MTIRNVIQSALSTPLDITSIVQDRVMHTSICQTTTIKPFIAWRLGEGDVAPGMGPVRVGELVVFCHDDPGDFGRVDQMLQAVIAAATAAKGPGEEGRGYVSAVEFLSATGDRYDQFFQSVVRSAVFRVVGRGI